MISYKRIRQRKKKVTMISTSVLRVVFRKVPADQVKRMRLSDRIRYLYSAYDYFLAKVHHQKIQYKFVPTGVNAAWDKFEAKSDPSVFTTETPKAIIKETFTENCNQLEVVIEFLDKLTTHQDTLMKVIDIF